ncbi:TMEM175 family protein [Aliinostoc sp. HNIBRCY26]|uniref:TMEM175 family protein n=1 Tax=Aliinostoc sp. HNIBRCY26 TaxID=3418997 RepID=UPI003D0232AC
MKGLIEQNQIIQSNQNSSESILSLARLSDSIFAFAMALMVIAFDLPEDAKGMTDSDINGFLFSQLKPLVTYAITFVLVATYWISHSRQLKYLKRTDENHLWISVGYLMVLFLVPLSNDLVITFPDNFLVKVWFSLNIAVIGFVSWLSWSYATGDGKLVDSDLDDLTIRSIKIKALIEPICALISIGVVYLNQELWDYFWVLLFFAYSPLEKYFNKSDDLLR